MPLPTPPSKLGNLLSPDEYKAKARPAKGAKKQSHESEGVESEPYGGAGGVPVAVASAPVLHVVAASEKKAPEADSGSRRRKQSPTAALLQTVANRGAVQDDEPL